MNRPRQTDNHSNRRWLHFLSLIVGWCFSVGLSAEAGVKQVVIESKLVEVQDTFMHDLGTTFVDPSTSLGLTLDKDADLDVLQDSLTEFGSNLERLVPIPGDAGGGYLASVTQPNDPSTSQALQSSLNSSGMVRYIEIEICRKFLPGEPVLSMATAPGLSGVALASGASALNAVAGSESVASMVAGAVNQVTGMVQSLSGPLPQSTQVLIGPQPPSVEGFLAGVSFPWVSAPPALSQPAFDGTSSGEFHSVTSAQGNEFHSTTRDEVRIGIECYTVYIPVEYTPTAPIEYDYGGGACSEVSVVPESAPKPKVAVTFGQPYKHFEYPRPIPLQAVIRDFDGLKFVCDGCGGGQGSQLKFIRDEMNPLSYKWTLTGKGSLNKPFKDMDDIQDRINELKAKIAAADASIATLQKKKDDLEATSAARKAAIDAEIAELEADKAKANQDIARLEKEITELNRRIAEKEAEIEAAKAEIARLEQSIVDKLAEIKELQKKIAGEPTGEEAAIGQRLKQLQAEIEAKQQEMAQLEAQQASREQALRQAYNQSLESLNAARSDLVRIRKQVTAKQQEITALEKRLYANSAMRNFINQRTQILGQSEKLKNKYFAESSLPPSPASQLLSTAQNLIRAVPAMKQQLLDQFSAEKNNLLGQLENQCAGLSGVQTTSCNADVDALMRELDGLSNSLTDSMQKPLIDPDVWKKLEQARLELSQLDQAAINAEQAVKTAEQATLQAQQIYLDGLAQLDSEATQKAEELRQLQDDETKTSLELKAAQVEAAIEREKSTPDWLEDIAKLRGEIEDAFADITEQRTQMEAAAKELDELITERDKKVAEKESLEAEVKLIDAEIARKQAEKAAIDQEGERIQQEIDAINVDKGKWEEELAALEEQLRNQNIARQGNKIAKGQQVYYIPPPLEEIMQKKPEFETFKEEVANKEAEYEQALRDKAGFQKQAFDIIKDMNGELWALKNASETAEKLDEEIKSLEDDKGAKETRYNADNQSKLGEAQAEKQRAQQEKTAKDSDLEEAKRVEDEEQGQVDSAKEEVDNAKQAEKEKEDDVFAKIEAYNFDRQKRQRKGEALAGKRTNHEQTLSRLRNKESELQRTSDQLSRALSAENETQAAGLRSQVEGIAAELRQLNQQVDQETAELQALADDFTLATVAEKGSKEAEEEAQQALFQAQRDLRKARQDLREETEDLDAAKEKRLAAERKAKISDAELKQAESGFDKAQKDLDEGTAELVADEDKKIEDKEGEKTDAEAKKTEAINKLNDLVRDRDTWKAKEAEAKQKVKDSWDAWKKAEKDLKDHVIWEIEHVKHNITIKLEADDVPMASWRSDDDPIIRNVKISYASKREPLVDGPKDNLDAPGPVVTSAICNPVVQFDPADEIAIATKPMPKPKALPEPQTIALYYKKGEPLYDHWPPRKDQAEPMQRAAWEWTTAAVDVDKFGARCVPGGGGGGSGVAIAIGNDFGGGSSTSSSSTSTSSVFAESVSETAETPLACAPGPPRKPEKIDDVIKYDWIIPAYSSRSEADIYMDTPKVPSDKCTAKLDLQVDYFDSGLQAEDKKKDKKSEKFDVLAGMKGDESKEENDFGYGDKVQLKLQIFDGAHHGLANEDVIWDVTSFKPEEDDDGEKKYGLGPDKKDHLEEKTDASGYSKVDFFLEQKYGIATVTAKWKRQNECEAAEIEISKVLSLHNLKVGFAPKEGWKEAGELFSGTGAADFEKIAKDLPDGPEGAVIFATGLLDSINNPLDGKKILYSVKEPDSVSMDPEEDETRIYGLAWSFAGDTPEDSVLKMLAKIEEKLKDVTDPNEVDGEQSTETTNRFLIGRAGQYLTIETDEEFVPGGEPLTGTGKLIADTSGVGIPAEFGALSLEIDGVTFNDDGAETPIAQAGTVKWDSAKAGVKPFGKGGFQLTLSKLGLSAGADGVIEGKVKVPGAAEEEVEFTATIGPSGFLGTISNFPEIAIGGMKLKQGAAVVIDLHDTENPSPMPAGWRRTQNGLLIRQGEIQLPDAFKGRAETPPVISFKDVYVDTGGLNGKIGIEYTVQANLGNMKFAIESFEVELKESKPQNGNIKGGVIFPDPFIGEVKAEVSIGADDSYKVTVKTDKVVNAPALGLAFKLIEATGEYKEQLFSFELSAALSSENFGNGDGDIIIRRFKFNSNGDIEAENIEINQDVQFGKGFKITLKTLSFKKTASEFKLALDTGFQFGTILTADKVAVSIGTGPVIEEFELDINVDRKPVTIAAKIKYKADLFSGEVDVDVEKLFGIKGVFILGAMKGDDPYQYWYVELNSDVAIPLGQSGLNLLQIGGGVGYNYDPPIGSAEGAPRHTDSFSLKAAVAIGNVPKGEVFMGRVALVLVADRFSVNGKLWLLTKEESLYGEGQLNLYWQPQTKLDGFVRMVIALPGSDGKLMNFTGQIDFRFAGSNDWEIKSRTLEGSVLQRILGEGTIEVKPGQALMDGNIRYDLAKEVELSVVTLKVEVHLRADGKLAYQITETRTTLDASLSFRGDWDVNLETKVKDFDIVSGRISALLKLHAVNRSVEVEGNLRVSWDTWVHSGSTNVDIGYSN